MALSNTNFRRRVWVPALEAAGLAGIHIHDLRHTGNHADAVAKSARVELAKTRKTKKATRSGTQRARTVESRSKN
jgi:integrase